MRSITIITLFCIVTSSWGQSSQATDKRFLTYEENMNWLMTKKSLGRSEQWSAIKQRLFLKENANLSADSVQYSPLLVINGVALNIPSEFTDKNREKILSLLNESSIEQISILDRISEKWIFCKPFSGVMMMTVDKKAGKKLSKLKLD